ncbi:MAG TPA: DUF1343 domain-containing protein [Streptosporangiaceae bacterium]|nr:DUF1343 domain-containing protein [Streptosporangiaceae bacterium]
MTKELSRRGVLAGGLTAGLTGGLTGGLGPAAPASAAGAGRAVRTGFEVLAADGYAALRGRRVGLLSNPTGVTRDLRHEADVLHAAAGVDLVAVFGPEHGFRGSAQAGGSEGSFQDPRTGLPVYDLFGANIDKVAGFFTRAGVDTVVFDIQDVGARFYTYIWTMFDAMRAAARTGRRFVVLDRPHPTGGTAAAGPVLHPEYASGVGKQPISQQHGMTAGELAGLFNAEFLPAVEGGPAELTVISMRGWRRGMSYERTGLPWVPPSPNMPTVDTAVVYPGLCLFEAVNLSEGRGTTRPFEIVGAPYADWRWADALTGLGLPGVRFREAYFAPTFSKWAGQSCAGVQLLVTDRSAFDPIRTAIAMIVAARRLYPGSFAWRESAPPYWIDTLTGSAQVRTAIDAGADADEVVAGWRAELARFRATRDRYLLYR